MATKRIPLFPLNVVLFPGMVLPLVIFEPRYQAMLDRCLAEDRLFGVCLIRSGREVGSGAVPWDVGTVAEIVLTEVGEAGRRQIHAIGRRRFRVLELFHEQPYLEADVEFLSPEDPADLGDLPALALERSRAYLGALLSANGVEGRDVDLPEDPLVLSYLVGALLQGDLLERQKMLEEQDLAARLRAQIDALERETHLLVRYGDAARPLKPKPGYFSLN